MEHYRRTTHTRFDIKFHFQLARDICVELEVEVEIIKGHVSKDRVHMFVLCPPHVSASYLRRWIKRKTYRELLMEFRHLQKRYWGRHLWVRGYLVASSGIVRDEAMMEYFRNQEGTEPDSGGHDFQMTNS